MIPNASGCALELQTEHQGLQLHAVRPVGDGELPAGGEVDGQFHFRHQAEDMDASVEVLHYEETAYTGMRYGMEKYYPTWKIPADHTAVTTGINAYIQLFGNNPVVDKWTFSTNGVTINGYYAIPIIGFGPGNEIYAHAPNEKVPVSDLVAASAFYAAYAFII